MGREETVISQLAELYESYGYSYYKVSRFEEYDLYARNRNFLSGGQILTFNDADGRLMALKPDVTLSIIKNTKDDEGMKKIYYKENVYRVLHSGSGFKEIMQSGLECIGDIDRYATGEVIMLAASSLESVSSEYILDISHIGITAGILEGTDDETADAILKAMSEKNAPMLEKICEKGKLPQEKKQLLEQLIRLYEPIGTGIERLKNMELPKVCREAVTELEELCEVLKLYGIDKNIYLDFSIICDTDYYNGIFFKGFIAGIAESVLSGGRYDNLMRRMGKKSGAIGFAVYLNQLENLEAKADRYDADVLITYSEGSDMKKIIEAAGSCIAEGKSVRVQKSRGARTKEVIEIGADN